MKVAIIGASGAVGRVMVEDLDACPVPGIEPRLFASPRSAGQQLVFRGKATTIEAFSLEAVRGVRYALMSAGGDFSREWARRIADQGTIVIDNSAAWRMAADVPLIVPEVNPDALSAFSDKGIVANPNCSTIQLVVPLKALSAAFGLEMVDVASYQSVSGAGQKGITELGDQVQAQLRFAEVEPRVFTQSIAFNIIPAIGAVDKDGHCGEEEKIVRETRKILGLDGLEVMVTTARVPTFHCHCEAVTVRLKRDVSRAEAVEALRAMSGLVVDADDDPKAWPSPRASVGDGRVFVARTRIPLGQTRSRWLQFWVVADNLKKGAATNAVQILELLEKRRA